MIKKLNDLSGGLNLTQSANIQDNQFKVAKNVFYNNAKQLQTRRGYTTFGNEIGSSPIHSYFFFQRDDTLATMALCHSGAVMYEYDENTDTRNSAKTGLIEYETIPGRDTQRIRVDYAVYKNVVYMADGVNPYAKYDGTTYSVIGGGGAVTCTFDNTTDYVNKTTHGLAAGSELYFGTTGTLPTGITAGQVYYVLSVDANNFQISKTIGGTALNFTSNGTGTHSYYTLSEPRIRYVEYSADRMFGAGEDANPNTLYYTNAAPSDGNNINQNSVVVGGDETGRINGMKEFAGVMLTLKSEKSYAVNVATPSVVAIDTESGGYSNRTFKNVGNSLVLFNDKGVDTLRKRSGVDSSTGIEGQSLGDNVRELTKLVTENNYNANSALVIKKMNNYYIAIDTNDDNRPDTVLVWNSLVGSWTQYTLPSLYDFGHYIDSDGVYKYLFASASGGQMYQFEYGFDDAGQPIDVEIESKDFDFDDPTQFKTFDFIDFVGYKQQGGDIECEVLVDDNVVAIGTIGDSNIQITNESGAIGVPALGTESLTAGSNDSSDLVLYPFRVKLPFFETGQTISYRMTSSGVQWILDKVRISVNAEPVEVFIYDNIL